MEKEYFEDGIIIIIEIKYFKLWFCFILKIN